MVDAYDRVVGTHSSITTDFPADKIILDWNGGSTNYISDYSKQVNPVVSPNVIVVGGPGTATTSTSTVVRRPTSINEDIATIIDRELHFATYLDWQPTGGIHVSIARLAWSTITTANYTGLLDSSNTPKYYGEYTSWKRTTNHPNTGFDGATAWTSTGMPERSLRKWSMNALTAKSLYTTRVTY
jgi:hypothetical protein